MRVGGMWFFLHLVGMALWLGGTFNVSLWVSRARRTGDPKTVAFAYATARRLYRSVVLSAAWISILSGAVLMIVTGRPWFRPFPDHWLFQMQVLGLIAVLATTVYVVPNAGALAKLAERAAEEGESSPEFSARLKGQAIVGSLVGALLVYAMLLGALRF
jgi:uncharacterized membrane protein